MPNLKSFCTRGDGFGTFPKAIINNCQYWGRERGERELQSLLENIPSLIQYVVFYERCYEQWGCMLHEGHDPDICITANGCTVITRGREKSCGQEKVTIFRYCQYCKGTSMML